jgi:fructuronate reductase
MADPATRIVTITVSEKGYCQDAATGNLDEKHPLIAGDLAHPTAPRSVPGLITEALVRRRAAGVPPFTVLSCDNLSENGIKARRIVTRYATVRDAELGAWISANVAFPCTMVDRITPATTDAVRADVAALTGIADGWPVVTEPFLQWVVEDNFPLGRPAWEKAGATMVKDVLPFEMMKLRCLNGSHSALAYLGTLLDLPTVYDAMSDDRCRAFVHRLWSEDIVPTVPVIAGVDVPAYTAKLEERFLNPRIRHLTIQISSDGSQKLPPRLLEPALERIKAGAHPRCVAFLVAAWMRFLGEKSESGQAYKVADPMAQRLTGIAVREGRDAPALAKALFQVSDIFTPELMANERFRQDVIANLAAIFDFGVAKALENFLAG